MPDLSGLTQLDRDVIDSLARSRVTASAVTLAADLWRPLDHTEGEPPRWSTMADPTGMVTFILTGLADKGLVTYRLRPTHSAAPGMFGRNPWVGLPMQIRLTGDGWLVAGFPTIHGHVGHGSRHSRDMAKHQHDMTNYRNHHDAAIGVGPIETLTFAEHRAKYPDHCHPLMYDGDTMTNHAELMGTNDAPATTRTYVRVTPEVEGSILAAQHRLGPTASQKDIAEQAGFPLNTVKYVLTDLPRLRRSQTGEDKAVTSLKGRLMAILGEFSLASDNRRVTDTAELRRILGRADTEHDIVHALHDLHTAGRIDFREAGARDRLVDIRLRVKGAGKKKAKVEDHGPVPEEVEEENPLRLDNLDGTTRFTVTDLAQEPDTVLIPPTYPLLDALIEREGQRLAADNTAMAYLNAAESLREVDPEMYASLVQKAEQADIPFPSPLEAEYLRYVRDHG
jgi:hypothetical protein